MNRGKALIETPPPSHGLPPTEACSWGQVSLERQLEDSLALLSSDFTKPIEDTQGPSDPAKG